MVHVDKMSFDGDPNVGLYAVATDKFVLIGRGVSRGKLKKLGEIFDVPVIPISVYGTNLVGLFISANSNNILVPEVIFKDELDNLKEKTKGLATVHVVKTTFNALGNNILATDKVAILNNEFPQQKVTEITNNLLGVKRVAKGIKTDSISYLPGTVGVITNKGGIFALDLPDSEVKKIEKLLGFEVGLGTANMGGKMIGSAVVANSNGFIISDKSSGYEISRVDESLGFLE